MAEWSMAAAAVAALYGGPIEDQAAAARRRDLDAQRRELERIKAMPRPKIECEGCGACAFDQRGCTYCRRPRLARPAAADNSMQLSVLYGYAVPSWRDAFREAQP